MQLVEDRFCPVCGKARAWKFGLQKHKLYTAGGAVLKITHWKFVNQPQQHQLLMASLLVDGKAQKLENLDEMRGLTFRADSI